MSYLLVFDDGYEGSSTQYDQLVDVINAVRGTSVLNHYSLYRVAEELNLNALIDYYNDEMEKARQAALAKLSQEDLKLLGLSKV